ncbi:MAG TPA: glycosyltransferase [Actinomycetota bacterium]|nr:glycosyltransferase [Candidatus Nanopelagicales bacterium]HPQ85176.1 glycosyltransferase [Actinomycetota bacterium]
MSNSHSPEYSYVVAAHNSEDVITETWSLLRKHFQSGPVEIVIVENGSTDGTWPTLQALATAVGPADPSLKVLRSEKGLGNALAAGALASRGKSIVFTADDLPFGFSDLEAYSLLGKKPAVAIGSKGHPGSTVQRGAGRDVLSTGFRLIRDAVLHLGVRDSQGTLIVDGDFARAFAPVSQETGYLWTTEFIFAARTAGFSVQEIPVHLTPRHAEHPSRVRAADVWQMFEGLARIRRRRSKYLALSIE